MAANLLVRGYHFSRVRIEGIGGRGEVPTDKIGAA